MSPYERVRARAAALDTLGVGPHSSQAEIRAAWRKVAFELHPDRNAGRHVDFDRARAAYELLCDDDAATRATLGAASAEPGVKPARPSPIKRRPHLPTRVVDLPADALRDCKQLLDRKSSGTAEDGDGHVPESVSLQGRSVTFSVDAGLTKGVNRIALPTQVFGTMDRPDPTILSFSSATDGSGIIDVPEAVCAQMFPGARSVRIRFLGGEVERLSTSHSAARRAV